MVRLLAEALTNRIITSNILVESITMSDSKTKTVENRQFNMVSTYNESSIHKNHNSLSLTILTFTSDVRLFQHHVAQSAGELLVFYITKAAHAFRLARLLVQCSLT